jgi:hypothetical protein
MFPFQIYFSAPRVNLRPQTPLNGASGPTETTIEWISAAVECGYIFADSIPYATVIRACLATGFLKSRLPNYSASANFQGFWEMEAEVVFGCTRLRLSV